MKHLVLAGAVVAGALACVNAQAASAPQRQPQRPVQEYARAECILPWYRFFGACDEAIDDSINWNSHSWQAPGRHRR